LLLYFSTDSLPNSTPNENIVIIIVVTVIVALFATIIVGRKKKISRKCHQSSTIPQQIAIDTNPVHETIGTGGQQDVVMTQFSNERTEDNFTTAENESYNLNQRNVLNNEKEK